MNPRAIVCLAALALSACPAEPGAPSPDLAPADLAAPPDNDAGTTTAFLAPELLGRPTATSIAISVVPGAPLELYVELGTLLAGAGTYPRQTQPALYPAGAPAVLAVPGLTPDTAYRYRLRYRRPGEATFAAAPERRFHTQRPRGQSFRFTLQADSHLDENSVYDQYLRTLANVLADAPDFHLDLGDTFMCEKYSEPLTASSTPATDEPTVIKRYLYERNNFATAAHSVPLFLVNGNHDGELGYLFTGGGNDLATWTTRARLAYFLNPLPDAFYSGDSMSQPVVGQRAAWYAFEWGDALFVALDPFWNSKAKGGQDAWGWTLGAQQYQWLSTTLAASQARFKFVFLHNLVGGLDGQMRGGVEAAPFYEWGGQNADGTPGFATRRPGWAKPIHQLLVDNKVTAVFHGHDHLYANQTLDGLVYQEVPQPSARNTQNAAMLAQGYHYQAGTFFSSAGHLRVTVAADHVTSEYVRSWLPANENQNQKNGEIAHSWTVQAR